MSISSSSLLLALGITVVLPLTTFAVDLGACTDFAVMAESAITFATNTIVNSGNVGIGSDNLEAITGSFNSIDGSVQQPSTVSQCKVDELIAYNFALSAMGTTITAEMGGKTFTAGIYDGTTLSTAAGDIVILSGGPTDTFIFQSGSTLDIGASTVFQLTGGACADNIFWTASAAALGADATFIGTVLSGSTITVGKGVLVNGRLFAQSAITFGDTNTIDASSSSVCAPLNLSGLANTLPPSSSTGSLSSQQPPSGCTVGPGSGAPVAAPVVFPSVPVVGSGTVSPVTMVAGTPAPVVITPGVQSGTVSSAVPGLTSGCGVVSMMEMTTLGMALTTVAAFLLL
jgi:hypothetical protein